MRGRGDWGKTMTPEKIDLDLLQTKLKMGEYDGVDIMHAWGAVGDLRDLLERNGRDERIASLEHEISETRAEMVRLRKQIDEAYEAMLRG